MFVSNLRDVRGHVWNHRRVHRTCCALEPTLRVKPRRRLAREKPEELAVPDAPNLVWSIDFKSSLIMPAFKDLCIGSGTRTG